MRVMPAGGNSVPLAYHDLSNQPEKEAKTRYEMLQDASHKQAFDLGKPPQLRILLARMPQKPSALPCYMLCITMHHASMDGWSFGVVFKDLPALYNAIQAGQKLKSAMPALPAQYSDFAKWHLAWERTPQAAAELTWWKETLQGVPHLLQLPLDHPRPEILSHRGNICGQPVPEIVAHKLESLIKDTGSSVVAVTLTAYKLMLHIFSGASDLLVGIPQSTREPGTQDLIGYFLNTVPVRSKINGTLTLRDLIVQETKALRATMAHSLLPWATIVEAMNVPRSTSYDPLVQYMLTFDDEGKIYNRIKHAISALIISSIYLNNAAVKKEYSYLSLINHHNLIHLPLVKFFLSLHRVVPSHGVG